MKFWFIAKHRGVWPVSWLCEALGVSRSGFHAWLGRAPSARARSDEMLGAKVRASFIASYRTYGARRVWHDVLAEGQPCGLHRIERLMRQQALKARPRRRGPSRFMQTNRAVSPIKMPINPDSTNSATPSLGRLRQPPVASAAPHSTTLANAMRHRVKANAPMRAEADAENKLAAAQQAAASKAISSAGMRQGVVRCRPPSCG